MCKWVRWILISSWFRLWNIKMRLQSSVVDEKVLNFLACKILKLNDLIGGFTI
jgi:hypothetical protein